jgi:pimeloyl-ACP methyl ester carboxylesterase
MSVSDMAPQLLVSIRGKAYDRVIKDEATIPDFVKYLGDNGFISANRQLVFVVHGYMGYTPWTTWLNQTRDALLKEEDSTVIVVNWINGADNVFSYPSSASNTQTIASVIGKVATAILNSDTFKGDKTALYAHCIGHSLGAHVCGQAGRDAPGVFDRATGLDPAGPSFENCTDRLHIDTDSADCVDNIHTDGVSNDLSPHFGTLQRWGHVDFYPNGGGNQPWCKQNLMPPCSHSAATVLFASTVTQDPNSPCAAEGMGRTADSLTRTATMQRMGHFSSCNKASTKVLPGPFDLTTDQTAQAAACTLKTTTSATTS